MQTPVVNRFAEIPPDLLESIPSLDSSSPYSLESRLYADRISEVVQNDRPPARRSSNKGRLSDVTQMNSPMISRGNRPSLPSGHRCLVDLDCLMKQDRHRYGCHQVHHQQHRSLYHTTCITSTSYRTSRQTAKNGHAGKHVGDPVGGRPIEGTQIIGILCCNHLAFKSNLST